MIKMNLKAIMDSRGLTIQDIYEKTGISRNTISLLYNGKSKGIQLSTLNKLMDILNIEANDFFVDSINYQKVTIKFEKLKNIIFPGNEGVFPACMLNFKDQDNNVFLGIPFYVNPYLDDLFQFECSSEYLPDDYKGGIYNFSAKVRTALENIGDVSLEQMISMGLCNFINSNVEFNKKPDYIGIRTDLALLSGAKKEEQNNQFSFNYLWNYETITNNKKLKKYLEMKFSNMMN